MLELPRQAELSRRAKPGEAARVPPGPKLLALFTAGMKSFTAFPGTLANGCTIYGPICASGNVCDVRIDSPAEVGTPSRPMPRPSLKVPKHWHDGHLPAQLLVDMGDGCRPRTVMPVSQACPEAVLRVSCQQFVSMTKRRPMSVARSLGLANVDKPCVMHFDIELDTWPELGQGLQAGEIPLIGAARPIDLICIAAHCRCGRRFIVVH